MSRRSRRPKHPSFKGKKRKPTRGVSFTLRVKGRPTRRIDRHGVTELEEQAHG